MFRLKFIPQFLYETPADGGSGPAAVSDPPAPAVQPGVVDPSQGAEQAGDDGFWGLFPNVPDEHRALLEPHIKEMQGHVTRVEQQLAPFKPFIEAGLTPESSAGLIQFSTDFDEAPLETWIRIGNLLQEQENGQGGFIVDPEVDLEYLAAIAQGQNPDDGTPMPAEPIAEGEIPPVAEGQPDSDLRARLEQLEQDREREQAERMETVQDKLLERRISGMRTRLTEAGWPEETLTDEALTAHVLTHKGNVEAATKSLIDQRSALLKGFVANTEPDELTDEPPERGERGPSVREKSDPFAGKRGEAKGFLRRQNRAKAQNA